MNDEENKDKVTLEIGKGRDARNYIEYLDIISKALAKKLEEMEAENRALREENSLLRVEAKDRESEFIDLVSQDEGITKRFMELEQRYTDMMERFEKEQRRIRLLETENARNMDELKSLRKENKSLLSVSSDKDSIMGKFKGLFKDKQ